MNKLELLSSKGEITSKRNFSQNLSITPEQVNDMKKAKSLLLKYNAFDYDNLEGKHQVLYELLHPDSRDHKMKPFIEPPFYVQYGYNVILGENFAANWECHFQDCAPITIGDNVMVGPGVQILTGDGETRRPVKLGSWIWLGGRSVIYPGVTIGDRVTVSAGSVVKEDIPSNVVVAGNPAKIKGRIDWIGFDWIRSRRNKVSVD